MTHAPEPLTLVIPLRLPPRPGETLRRLAGILAAAPPEIAVVIADDTASAEGRAQVAALARSRPGTRHLRIPEGAEAPFRIGRLRDRGAEAAREGFVLFHDVDFAAPPAFYRRLLARLRAGLLAGEPDAFRCIPVAFLTLPGTLAWRAAPDRLWRALQQGEPLARRLSIRLTRGSSAMLLRRRTLLEAGGHAPGFKGHGAEDFELMHRLSQACPLGPRPPAYARDFGSRHAGPEGFRAYFARYGEPMLSEGLVMAHLWHPPRREDPRYYAARKANFARLEAALQG